MAWLDEFLAEERLPPEFRATMEAICIPLADAARARAGQAAGPLVVGLCGSQGSGKSTIAAATARLLADMGLACARLSIDDLYMTREERRALARRIHPLLVTRGPPGTHEVGLGEAVLDALAAGGPVLLPRFDKGRDTRRPPEEWESFGGAADIVIFEGWCVGARPQPETALLDPVNALEAEEDPHGVWRAYVNDQLAGPYRSLFARIGLFAFLQAPGFDAVLAWRTEQEAKLRAREPHAPKLMSPTQIARFIAHYERVTRHLLEEAPSRADLVFRIDARRRPLP